MGDVTPLAVMNGCKRALLWLLGFACVPGWAASYSFPGSLPAGCTTVSTGVYSCAALTLGTSDTVTVSGTATVNVTGNLAIKSSQVNASGAAANLTLNVSGSFSATVGAKLNANLTAGSVSSTGAVSYGGSVATTGSGAVSLDNGTTVAGSLSTVTGAVTLSAGTSSTYSTIGSINSGGTVTLNAYNRVTGDVTGYLISGGTYNNIGGNLLSTTTYVSFPDYVTVGGSITGQTYVFTGHHANVGGAIVANTLQVDTASYSSVGGAITSKGSYVNLGGHTTVGGAIVAKTYVDTGSSSTVNGDITSQTSYIDTGTGVTVYGSLTAGGTYIDIHSDANITGSLTAQTYVNMVNHGVVGGSITAVTGTVSVNDYNQVGGNVQAAGAVTIDDHTVISGNVASSGSSVYLSIDTSVAGSVTASTTVHVGSGTSVAQCVRSNGASTITIHSSSSVAGACCGTGTTCTKSCISASPVPPNCATLHHLQIQHASGTGLTCSPDAVTVVACANSACTSYVTTGVTGTLTATGAGMTVNYPSGAAFSIPAGSSTTTVSFQQVTAGSTTWGATTVSPSPTVAATCNFGSPSCTYTAADSGFVLTMPAHVAGTSSSLSLAAVKKSATSTTCTPGFASVSKPVTLRCSYSDPVSGTLPVLLNGVGLNALGSGLLACDGTGQTLNLAFNASGVATTTLQYNDVGKVTVSAQHTGSGSTAGLSMSGSSTVVAAPASFAVGGVTAGPIKAGSSFSATVTALNALGGVTPNFGKEASPEGVRWSWAKYQPTGAGASAGSFTGSGVSSTLTGFNNGAVTASDLVWTEVGSGDLSVALASGNYLSSGLTAVGSTGAVGAVGSFIPHHFDLGVTQGCSGAFTYSGQPFTVAIRALNALNGTTTNYNGTGATSPQLANAVTLTAVTNGSLGSFSGGTATVAAGSFVAGLATVATPTFTFAAKLTPPSTVQLRATDLTAGFSSSGGAEGSVILRSGRLRISNAFGTEKSAMTIPAQTQYWSGKAWVLNSLDACTVVPVSAVALGNFLDAKGSATTGWTTSVTANGSGKAISISGGNANLTLAKPTSLSSAAAVGSVDIGLNLGSAATDASCLSTPRPSTTGAGLNWLRAQFGSTHSCAGVVDYLRDPSSRATFGVFAPELHRLIHAAEVH